MSQSHALVTNLSIHPAAQILPMPEEKDPASKAMVTSILDLGRITDSLKVCKLRVVDGRMRLRGAIAAGLDEVPIEEVAEEEVTSIILHSLLARRHFSKGALAYLACPLMEGALAESRKRRLENLKIGVSTSKPRKSTQCTIGNTAEEMGEALGVGRSLLFMARAIWKKFAASPVSIRATWEPKLLSGEMGLGEVAQAISGALAGMDDKTTPKNDAQLLLFDLFNKATVRFGRWGKLNAKQQQAAAKEFRDKFLPSLPPELLEEAHQFLNARLATH